MHWNVSEHCVIVILTRADCQVMVDRVYLNYYMVMCREVPKLSCFRGFGLVTRTRSISDTLHNHHCYSVMSYCNNLVTQRDIFHAYFIHIESHALLSILMMIWFSLESVC